MRYTEELLKEIGEILPRLIRLPFIRKLAAGSLDRDRFDFYVQQDVLYLVDYTRALSLIAAKAGDAGRMLQFLKYAGYSLEVEKERHDRYMAAHRIPPAAGKSPACFSYTNFLLSAAALETVEVGMASVLPCFCVYEKVAEYIYAHASGDNPYRDWINLYAGGEFKQATGEAMEITDGMAFRAGESTREKMKEAFVLATRMEYMFWDSAYRKEQWIV
jgi:thiaminase/transcriptional activator TenA